MLGEKKYSSEISFLRMDTDLTEQRLKMRRNHDLFYFNYMKFLLRASKDHFCYHLTDISGFNNNVLYWLI